MMKRTVTAILLALFSGAASAVWIEGYTKPDGIYVPGHWSDEPKDYAKEDREYRQEQQRKSSQQEDFNSYHHAPDLNKNLYEPHRPRY